MNVLHKALAPVFFILLIGCGNGSSSAKPPRSQNGGEPPAEVGKMFAEVTGELPALPKASSFEPNLTGLTYPKTAAPADAPLLHWDFSPGRIYGYDFDQEVRNSNLMGGSDKPVLQEITGNGLTLLKSKDNNTALLLFKDMTFSMTMSAPGSQMPKMDQKLPPFAVEGVREDGIITIGDSSMDLMLQAMFPVPPKALKVGDSFERKGKLPLNMMGSVLHATGPMKTTLVGYVNINGRTCAQLDTDINISELKVPAELQANYRGCMRGKSIFYFDIQDRCFVEGQIAIVIGMRADMPTPKVNFPSGNAPPIKMPEKMRMVMDGDNYIVLKRNLHIEMKEHETDKSPQPANNDKK